MPFDQDDRGASEGSLVQGRADHELSSITEDVLAHVFHALRSGFRGSVAASSSAHGFSN